MTEKVYNEIKVFSLDDKTSFESAVDAVINGKITLLRVGSVFSLICNPNIDGLTDKLNLLKGRLNQQYTSVVCSNEQARQLVCESRINKDFYRMPADLTGKVIVRIPVDDTKPFPFPYNSDDSTLQFLNFDEAHHIRSAFRKEVAARGCGFISITSGNLHSTPTIEDPETAKRLAVLFNIKASFFGFNEIETIVADIPGDKGAHKGSFIILSFCNPNAIEVKRLANKTDREVTEKYLNELFADIETQTPLIYSL
jgi:hypothetical protein